MPGSKENPTEEVLYYDTTLFLICCKVPLKCIGFNRGFGARFDGQYASIRETPDQTSRVIYTFIIECECGFNDNEDDGASLDGYVLFDEIDFDQYSSIRIHEQCFYVEDDIDLLKEWKEIRANQHYLKTLEKKEEQLCRDLEKVQTLLTIAQNDIAKEKERLALLQPEIEAVTAEIREREDAVEAARNAEERAEIAAAEEALRKRKEALALKEHLFHKK